MQEGHLHCQGVDSRSRLPGGWCYALAGRLMFRVPVSRLGARAREAN